MRIAFIGGRGVAARYSGIETYYEAVGAELAARGHDVRVYCRSYFTPPTKWHNGMRVVRIPTLRLKHLETVLHSFLSALHAMVARQDIVHIHALGSSVFAPLVRLTGAKVVVSVQGLDWRREKWGTVARAVLRLCERTAVRFPHATVVVSRVLQEYLKQKYGALVHYIPNGVLVPRRREPNLIYRLGLERDQYVLYLGRLSPEKNCHMLIEAFETMDTCAKLVIAGGGLPRDPYVAALQARASDRILFPGYVAGELLEELLSNTGVFVLPSSIEGLSIALLEAMSYGVCVLTSDIPENRELVDGVGYCFAAGDVADLKRILGELMADAAKRKSAGTRAAAAIASRYRWSTVAADTERLYQSLLSDRPRASH